jgi:sugar transferase (PEP-CTERM/EpsH1 system associated)
MAEVLYLVHRVPYPPDKGDKVRSYHLLRHIASHHRVHLATFADDPADLAHEEPLRRWCASLHIEPLATRRSRIASLRGLLAGEALSLPYYRSSRLADWVKDTCATNGIGATIVFSSVMAQYVPAALERSLLVDFVDVDSAKWTQYAARHPWPMSWLYRREGVRLLDFERKVAARAKRAFFVTEAEVALFKRLAPECGNVEAVGNGVDADYFSPDAVSESPFPPGEISLVFTGAMDYWPNIDAVTWFSTEVVPELRARYPNLRFHIVGRSPASQVRALANDVVSVTGSVPDVRPFLRHAAVVVAPLRVARGVQNKILEAMSMGRAVVAAEACAGGIEARPGSDYVVASDADDYMRGISALIDDPGRAREIGVAARKVVLERYSWHTRFSTISRLLTDESDAG